VSDPLEQNRHEVQHFSKDQIFEILNQQSAGERPADLFHQDGINEAMLYNWRPRDGGSEVSDAERPRALEDIASGGL